MQLTKKQAEWYLSKGYSIRLALTDSLEYLLTSSDLQNTPLSKYITIQQMKHTRKIGNTFRIYLVQE